MQNLLESPNGEKMSFNAKAYAEERKSTLLGRGFPFNV